MKIGSYIGSPFTYTGPWVLKVGEVVTITEETYGEGWRKIKGRVDAIETAEDGTNRVTGIVVEDLYIEDAQA